MQLQLMRAALQAGLRGAAGAGTPAGSSGGMLAELGEWPCAGAVFADGAAELMWQAVAVAPMTHHSSQH